MNIFNKNEYAYVVYVYYLLFVLGLTKLHPSRKAGARGNLLMFGVVCVQVKEVVLYSLLEKRLASKWKGG